MSELKFRQQCLAWDSDYEEHVHGKFIVELQTGCAILRNGIVEYYNHCKLDPDATGFMNGSLVEVRDEDTDWVKATYIGKAPNNEYFPHICETMSGIDDYEYCRHPQSKEQRVKKVLDQSAFWGKNTSVIAKEIVEALINGLFCQYCGEFLDGYEPGYPRSCDECIENGKLK